jgi:peptidoglycan/LPS O-acetylase OafA/YrhL
MAIAPPFERSIHSSARHPDTRAASVTSPRVARDSGIDFVRALCVTGVVILHAMMVGVTVTDAGPVFENAGDGAAWLAPLSWILQVMPLFFVIGGFAGLLAYRRQRGSGAPATAFVAARLHRLLLPAAVTIGFIGAILALLPLLGVPADLIELAGYRYGQPLWFLGAFLFCQALLPALAAAHVRAPKRTIAALAAAAGVVDLVRGATGIDAIGFINLALVWTALQQLGFFLADGTIDGLRRRTRSLSALVAVGALVGSWLSGVYSPDLIQNINPPTAALLLVGVAHTALLSLFRTRVTALSRRRAVAVFTTFVTRRALTIYLWHMPVLLSMAAVSALASLWLGFALPPVDSVGWWIGRPFWIAAALVLTAGVALIAARVETVRMPRPTTSAGRLAAGTVAGLAAVVVLLGAGASAFTATIALVLLLLALRLARPTVRRADASNGSDRAPSTADRRSVDRVTVRTLQRDPSSTEGRPS